METLSNFSEHWMKFMVLRSLDFILAFGFIGLVWFFIHKRVSSQFGYLLVSAFDNQTYCSPSILLHRSFHIHERDASKTWSAYPIQWYLNGRSGG